MSFCSLGENCAVYDRALKLPGVAHSGVICEGCRARTHTELDLLRFDYVDLTQFLPRRGAVTESEIFRPKPESSPPIDMSVFTLRGEIAYSLMISDRALRAFLGDRPRDQTELTVREGFAVDRSVRYLQPRIEDLARMPATAHYWDMRGDETRELTGADVLVLISVLHRRARRACGVEPRVIVVPGFCPQCDTSMLRRSEDDPDKLWCQRCSHKLSKSDYLRAQQQVFTRSDEP